LLLLWSTRPPGSPSGSWPFPWRPLPGEVGGEERHRGTELRGSGGRQDRRRGCLRIRIRIRLLHLLLLLLWRLWLLWLSLWLSLWLRLWLRLRLLRWREGTQPRRPSEVRAGGEMRGPPAPAPAPAGAWALAWAWPQPGWRWQGEGREGGPCAAGCAARSSALCSCSLRSCSSIYLSISLLGSLSSVKAGLRGGGGCLGGTDQAEKQGDMVYPIRSCERKWVSRRRGP
jgi:hypothetical protein